MSKKVLVVDDVQDVALTLAALVSDMGHEATFVTDPRLALETAEKFRPQVILLDIGMPYINGYQLAPILRKGLGESVRIVAVTAWGSEKDREHSRALGFSAHLTKPVDEATLQKTIDNN